MTNAEIDPKSDDTSESTDPGVDGDLIHDARVVACVGRYWRSNVAIMVCLLAIWAAVGLGCGILFADTLNQFEIGGFPLGFWFAQQGSILTFVVLILIYALLLNRLDAKHRVELRQILEERSKR